MSASTHRSSVRRAAMCCPHCGEATRTTYSRLQSPVCRQGGIECTDPECGWRGSFSLTIDSTSVPASVPNDRVNLPLSQAARQRMRGALTDDDARRVDMSNSR